MSTRADGFSAKVDVKPAACQKARVNRDGVFAFLGRRGELRAMDYQAAFAKAVDDYLAREGAAIAQYVDELDERSPFRRGGE